MSAGDWAGRHLGDREVSYTERDAILYALAIGAPADRLDLVFEERLRVLPLFGLTLAQWAPDILSDEGVFDDTSVHGSQTLEVHAPLPRSGSLHLSARVGNVWDKGSAAIFEVVVECAEFTATWSIFAPGKGGFGGERGPARPTAPEGAPAAEAPLATARNQAALYRLTGDLHRIHIDPEASARIGQPRPILQGLCTLAAATLPLADLRGAHPANLRRLTGRFSGPVVPGDRLTVRSWHGGAFDVVRDGTPVISDATAEFA